MEMQASRTLAVSQQQAWEALNDPEVLKLCIPGCDKFAPAGNNQFGRRGRLWQGHGAGSAGAAAR